MEDICFVQWDNNLQDQCRNLVELRFNTLRISTVHHCVQCGHEWYGCSAAVCTGGCVQYASGAACSDSRCRLRLQAVWGRVGHPVMAEPVGFW